MDNFQEFTQKQWADRNYKLETGESLNDVLERAVPIFIRIQNENPGNFVISSHGTWLAVLFNELTKGEFGYEAFMEMNFPDVYCGEFNENNQLISLKKFLT